MGKKPTAVVKQLQGHGKNIRSVLVLSVENKAWDASGFV